MTSSHSLDHSVSLCTTLSICLSLCSFAANAWVVAGGLLHLGSYIYTGRRVVLHTRLRSHSSVGERGPPANNSQRIVPYPQASSGTRTAHWYLGELTSAWQNLGRLPMTWLLKKPRFAVCFLLKSILQNFIAYSPTLFREYLDLHCHLWHLLPRFIAHKNWCSKTILTCRCSTNVDRFWRASLCTLKT